MVTPSESNSQGYVKISTAEHSLTIENLSEIRLTPQEKEEIKDKAAAAAQKI